MGDKDKKLDNEPTEIDIILDPDLDKIVKSPDTPKPGSEPPPSTPRTDDDHKKK